MSASPHNPWDGLPHDPASHGPDLPPQQVPYGYDVQAQPGWTAPPASLQWDGYQWVQVPMAYSQPADQHPPHYAPQHPQAPMPPHVEPHPPVPGTEGVQTYRAEVFDATPAAVPYAEVARDPQRTAMAAVITFIAAIIGLWAILGYVHDMAVTLSSVNASDEKLLVQMEIANDGLDQLDAKTSKVKDMNAYSKRLAALMTQIDTDMGEMLTSVNGINTEMGATSTAIGTLDQELGAVGQSDRSLANTLGDINVGLGGQAANVKRMRTDLQATSGVIEQVPAMLRTTNSRLGFINRVVCKMGTDGLANRIKLTIEFLIPLGSAEIFATIAPAGAWTC